MYIFFPGSIFPILKFALVDASSPRVEYIFCLLIYLIVYVKCEVKKDLSLLRDAEKNASSEQKP